MEVEYNYVNHWQTFKKIIQVILVKGEQKTSFLLFWHM